MRFQGAQSIIADVGRNAFLRRHKLHDRLRLEEGQAVFCVLEDIWVVDKGAEREAAGAGLRQERRRHQLGAAASSLLQEGFLADGLPETLNAMQIRRQAFRDIFFWLVQKIGGNRGATLVGRAFQQRQVKPVRRNAIPIKEGAQEARLNGSKEPLACEALIKLAAFSDEGRYRDLAEESLTLIAGFVLRYPLGFARWLSAAEIAAGTMRQVAVLGEAQDEDFRRMLKAIQSDYRPNVVVAASSHPIKEVSPALLEGRGMLGGRATAYVCEGFVCKQPVTELEALVEQLNNQ